MKLRKLAKNDFEKHAKQDGEPVVLASIIAPDNIRYNNYYSDCLVCRRPTDHPSGVCCSTPDYYAEFGDVG